MRINYGRLLSRTRQGAAWAGGFVATTIVGGFILKLCEDTDWYKHAWKTVAAMIAIVNAIFGSAWFHWIGGAILGFGIGIWIDDLLRRLAAKHPQSPIEMPELGFLDYTVDMQDAFKHLNKIMLDFAARTKWIGAEIAKRTEALSAVAGRPDSPKKSRQLKYEADKGAAKLDQYRRYIEKPSAQLNDVVNRVVAAIEWSVTNRPEKLTQEQIDSLIAGKVPMTFAREGVLAFTTTLRGSRGASAKLNRSIDAVCPKLDQVKNDLERLEHAADAIINSQASASKSLPVASLPVPEPPDSPQKK